MNILIIGSGAREHAIAKALAYSNQKPHLYCFATSLNPGIRALCKHYVVGDITDAHEVINQATLWHIDLAIIGPEAPLEQGIADELWQMDIPTIGPKKALAQIETSKQFGRDLMHKYSIPGLPKYKNFNSLDNIAEFINELGQTNYVIKANGLMGGKGVKVAGEHLQSVGEALAFAKEILGKKQTLIIEEKLIGQEFSFMCFADGKKLIPMPLVQDHKRAYNGDKGPNTGGMGSYSDSNHSLPFLTSNDLKEALQINQQVFTALNKECNQAYIGILYGSFIATKQGVFVIEFNARFGDPEALNVLSILESDFLVICQHLVMGDLTPEQVQFKKQATVCKYAVPEGYPDSPLKNFPIDFAAIDNKQHLYLAAVDEQNTGTVTATGSRTAAYVGIADTITAAEQLAEKAMAQIKGPLFHRTDIGTAPLIEQRVNHMKRIRNA
ncbi:phosphoribosylamine-glycine ligase [Legionella beliardensis]|uniref:Phosphoribosylamine--glycine ligase n=1 Tax=Legionella beliardensis TaxID=91822 RepID=A0A378I147_9GAMM|nr:phosphoribosylamine--glycine ligase [Legionella beliardensis]STX28703.1 phosphoribosylamine-glycine ligase [Legionella beliardensis]